tara:strand:- start:876 stop:1265 length:390 start_codon:yes stop_codon:yes gene_type:complete
MNRVDTKGPFRFDISADGSVEIGENSTDAGGSILNYALDEKYCLHVIQAPTLSAVADTITVYGAGLGGGWAKIGSLAGTANSLGFIEIRGGWWTRLKVVGASLPAVSNPIFMISRIPDLTSGVHPRTVI